MPFVFEKGSSGKVWGVYFQAYVFDNLNRNNFISLTPLEVALNALTFALKDSTDAFVPLLIAGAMKIEKFIKRQKSRKLLEKIIVGEELDEFQLSWLEFRPYGVNQRVAGK